MNNKLYQIMEDFADNVAKLCIEKYNFFKKTALATGTKCLGESELINDTREKRGSRLSDSHAEVLARRAFIRYFQTPCGDCSIFPKHEIYDNGVPVHKIRRIREDTCGYTIVESYCKDIHRTGAKCVKGEEIQDSRLPGVNYHTIGPLRTKPGRGNPTNSLSCSDKMAKWLILGLQGSLLSLLIPPIKLKSITIGGSCPFSLDAMERGLYKRFNNEMDKPKIFQAKIAFIHKKGQQRSHPCPTSIIWCAVRNSILEVAAAGRKQGVTKKKKGNNLFVSRRMLLQTFLQIFDKYQDNYNEIRHPKKITYYDWKQWSLIYQSKWKQLKLESFHKWPCKSVHLQNFTL
ncbi:tRNA-specific adenosine deaminase 1 isoform X4 [Camponotus floridanus]|uniref:tRNA-specific adenosine deaminase 1 isoform X4 n=1 Tax=Camponotus floridanus TaxID=104421 RepID=UPI000DC6852F|nr:tRNA-specific adenosine deaminase 1 isoform X4 [Camponotus floridanus]